MKNYIIAFLVVCLVVMGTFLYKAYLTPVLNGFPLSGAVVEDSGEPPLYLFIFLSRNNCHVCMEAVTVLNMLPKPFVVTGIVPGEELRDEAGFRKTTGATFRLAEFQAMYRRFNPYYSPAIFGVSAKGRVLFVLPGVPEQKEYLYNFLVNFYGKAMELLIPV
ncbi:MAG: hypothetical protein GY765_07205 [bacterium]|nr:hypothetical protein [bacterium]